MSRLSREEMLNKFNNLMGDNNSDDVLSFIEDINDTVDVDNGQEIETLRATVARLENENKELDNNWREKYKSRFFDGEITPPTHDDEDIKPPKKLTYENLFKEN